MISYKDRPVTCAILAWLALAFGVFCWNLLWLVIDVTGGMEIARHPYLLGRYPATLLGWPWSHWPIDNYSISMSDQILIFLNLCINATILGLFFGVIQKATPTSFVVLRAFFKLIFALTVIPMFIALMVLNINMVHTVAPGLVDAAVAGNRAGGRGGMGLGAVIALPLGSLICYLWYRFFVFLTIDLLGDLRPG